MGGLLLLRMEEEQEEEIATLHLPPSLPFFFLPSPRECPLGDKRPTFRKFLSPSPSLSFFSYSRPDIDEPPFSISSTCRRCSKKYDN